MKMNGQEDDEGERHHPRHAPAGIAVTHNGDGQDARTGRAHALQRAGRDHRFKRPRQRREQAEGDIKRQAGEEHRPAAKAVGQRSVEQLRRAEPQHIGGDDPLPLVALGNPQRLADGRQCRQHPVDRQRVDRHQRGDQGDELSEAEPARRARFGLCGGGHRNAFRGSPPMERAAMRWRFRDTDENRLE